jgi:hypothetical protein
MSMYNRGRKRGMKRFGMTTNRYGNVMSSLLMKRSTSYSSSSSPVPADIARCDHALAGEYEGLRNGA